MFPRALVLAADEKLAAPLRQALAAVGCEGRFCPDIFSSIEAVTRETFGLLVIDWTEHLEANFLLETTRGLKSNRSAFVVAMISPQQGEDALGSGAQAVLVKPFTAEHAADILRSAIEKKPTAEKTHLQDAGSRDHQPAAPREPVRQSSKNVRSRRELTQTAKPPVTTQRTLAASAVPATISEFKKSSKLSRLVSGVAVIWPVIIVASLFAFDQWPSASRRLLSGLKPSLAAPGSTATSARTSSDRFANDEALINPAAPSLSNSDLLTDYDSPPPAPLAPEVKDVDLASVRSLPVVPRLTAPSLLIERPSPDIPNSLRLPPAAQAAKAVSPTGNLMAPASPQSAAIELPESVTRSLLERQVSPQYPAEALKKGINGTVVLKASIGKDGSVRDLKLVSGYLVLARAAMDAVRQWHYRPYQRNGKNFEIETLITVDFSRPRG